LVPLPQRNAGNHQPGGGYRLSPHLWTKVYAEAENHYSHVLLHSKCFKLMRRVIKPSYVVGLLRCWDRKY